MRQLSRFPLVLCWLSYLALGASVGFSAPPPPDGDIDAAKALIARVLPGAEKAFVCEKIPAEQGRDVFEYEAGENRAIVLRGNSAGSLAVAFNQYLHREARLDFDWLASGPLSGGSLPPPVAKVHRACAAQERFFLNYCTFGYTMPWWDWAQWERFIDWMAMNGINRPLMQAGQEAVWLDVWQSYGLKPDEIRAYFSGPAHLPWHRMGNLDRWGGPLPLSYIEGQRVLEQQILSRARALSMKPILPAFAGHVPPELAKLRPDAHVVGLKPGWSGMSAGYATHFLDPKDPLFAEIQGRFLARQQQLYGSDHLYAADPFNEMSPPSWEAGYLASVGESIYRGMSIADPEARWYQMTWTFTYDKLKGHWTDERLSAMLHAVPNGRMVLLDYAAEEREFYSSTHNAFGLPFIWNYIGNFGGNTHLFAPLQRCEGLAERALAIPNCIGIGCTLEGLGVNPVIYEMLLEQPWSEHGAVDVPRWVEQYADRRAGRIDSSVREAWQRLATDVLAKTSRRAGTYGSVFQRMPRVPSWRGRSQNSRQDYAAAALVAALEKLLAAAPEAQRADGYRYDVVNFTRQALCNLGDQVAARMEAAAAAGNLVQFQQEAGSFLALGQDLDVLLGTRREFLLGIWLEQARSWAVNPPEADAYEANAREILTSWHEPGGELTDYASRQWNGLMRDYYLRRWGKWISLTSESLKNHTPFPEESYIAWVNDACEKWIHSTASHYATRPEGDEVATAKRLFLKYHPELVATEFQTMRPALVGGDDVFALATDR